MDSRSKRKLKKELEDPDFLSFVSLILSIIALKKITDDKMSNATMDCKDENRYPRQGSVTKNSPLIQNHKRDIPLRNKQLNISIRSNSTDNLTVTKLHELYYESINHL
jgi:hypothetical protein